MRWTMRIVLGLVAGGLLVPVAAAQGFRANVVSWSPNVVSPGEPVSVVLTLRADPAQRAGTRADGRRKVAVVIRGRGQTRRFAATPLGSGRYRTTVIFPEAGQWAVRVQYRGGETGLGKGAACVGDCADAQETRSSPAAGYAGLRIGVLIVAAVVLMAAVFAAALSRRRLRAS